MFYASLLAGILSTITLSIVVCMVAVGGVLFIVTVLMHDVSLEVVTPERATTAASEGTQPQAQTVQANISNMILPALVISAVLALIYFLSGK